MIYQAKEMEQQGVLQTAARMCTAARTAPKTKGIDSIHTLVLTGEEKDQLADLVVEIGQRDYGPAGSGWFERDAASLRASDAVVLIGTDRRPRGVPHCGFCGFGDCAGCQAAGGTCAYPLIDLGIALSSAVLAASDCAVDNRMMWSVGKAAAQQPYADSDLAWIAIPLSVSGKNIYFDRSSRKSRKA